MKSIKYFAWMALGLAGAFLPLFSDTGNIKFERIGIREGLSQSTVRSILQDRRGFLWFATVDGLNQYDGYDFKVSRPDPRDPASISSPFLRGTLEDRDGKIWICTNGGGLNRLDPLTGRFTRYRHDPQNPHSLSNDYAWAVHEDRSGMLWIGTDGGGLDRFDREKGIFTHYRHRADDPHSLSDDRVLAITEDGEGMLWVGTRGGGLNKLDPLRQQFTRYRHHPGDPGSLSHDHIWAVCVDRSGELWIGTNGGGMDRLVRETETFFHYRHHPGNPHSLSHDRVYTIYEDRRGTLWIGTNGGGLDKLDPVSGHITHYRNDPYNPDSLGDNHVYSIYEDRAGVLWVGTENSGVNKLSQNKEQFIHYRRIPGNPDSLSENHVWSIYEDRQGILWVGTRSSGFCQMNRQTGRVTHYGSNPDDPLNTGSGGYVRAIYEAPSEPGILWLGVDGFGLRRFDPKTKRTTRYRHRPDDPASLSDDRVYCILEDRSGGLWVGTRTGGLNRFDRQKKQFVRYQNQPHDPHSLSNDYVYSLHQDRSGTLWVGTFSGGLNRFHREKGTFTHYLSDGNDPHSLSSNCILDIHEDSRGRLWLATGGGGLNRFDPRTGRSIHYTIGHGVPSEVIYGILEDRRGNLWMSANNGLTRFNPQTEVFKHYTEKDGLQSDEFNGGSYYRSPRTGEMFFGGINGFNAFFPDRIKDNTHVPPVVITRFLKFNKEAELDRPISEVKELTLSYRDYVFSFEFTALDFTVPEKNRYAYRMEGLDEDWITTDSRKRFATYTTLTPGRYVFRVKGSNNDGVWNREGASIRITITPPFWQTWWFLGGAVLFIFLILWSLYKKRMKNVSVRTRMETELQTAHDTQMSIMPQKGPEIEGFDIAGACIPASEVGGDFFDYLWLDKKKNLFGIAVGDVSGKAMKAAMTAVMSNGIIFSKASESNSLEEILVRLNHSLYYKTDKRVFTALLVISIDIDSRKMTYINAGLPEPLVKSGDAVAPLKSSGSKFPLGVFRESRFQEEKIRLKPGDTVVLFTDGIPESWDLQHELYGTASLKRLLENLDTASLSSRQVIDRIIEDIRRFSDGVDQHDDMTVVVVKVSE